MKLWALRSRNQRQTTAYLRLLVSALIGRLQTLHRHALIGRLEAPQPMVGLRVALTQVFTRTPGRTTQKNNKQVTIFMFISLQYVTAQ